MSIVTKKGDRGETGLADGSRLPKSDGRFHAVGTVDELNAAIGVVLAMGEVSTERTNLQRLQHLLFRLGADLSTPFDAKSEAKRMGEEHVREIEEWITALESSLPPLSQFILPGGSQAAARIHVARTICRRAERWVVSLAEFESINSQALIFLNRLSDYLFLAAREQSRTSGGREVNAEY